MLYFVNSKQKSFIFFLVSIIFASVFFVQKPLWAQTQKKKPSKSTTELSGTVFSLTPLALIYYVPYQVGNRNTLLVIQNSGEGGGTLLETNFFAGSFVSGNWLLHASLGITWFSGSKQYLKIGFGFTYYIKSLLFIRSSLYWINQAIVINGLSYNITFGKIFPLSLKTGLELYAGYSFQVIPQQETIAGVNSGTILFENVFMIGIGFSFHQSNITKKAKITNNELKSITTEPKGKTTISKNKTTKTKTGNKKATKSKGKTTKSKSKTTKSKSKTIKK